MAAMPGRGRWHSGVRGAAVGVERNDEQAHFASEQGRGHRVQFDRGAAGEGRGGLVPASVDDRSEDGAHQSYTATEQGRDRLTEGNCGACSERGAAASGGGRGRGRGRGRGLGVATPRSFQKGLNFIAEEERQLARSVLAVSQDPTPGNQQKAGAFWQRISQHYDANRPAGERPARSLETKWGAVKHEVNKFIGFHQQVVAVNKSGTCKADILRKTHELYRESNPKHLDFAFEHVWLLVKDIPRWADGWGAGKPSTPAKRKGVWSHQDSQQANSATESEGVVETDSDVDGNRGLRLRPGGTKAAKEIQKMEKIKEGASYKQAQAMQVMADAVLEKNALLAEANLLILMTANDGGVVNPAAAEYLKLRQEEELRKYKEKLAAERQHRDIDRQRAEERERQIEAEQERARPEAHERERAETDRQHGEADFAVDEFDEDQDEDAPIHEGDPAAGDRAGEEENVDEDSLGFRSPPQL